MNLDEINIGALAYLGDSVYEVSIRKKLITKKINKSNLLQKESLKYVSAIRQSEILDDLIERNVLTSSEEELVKRARNYKPNSKPKYAKIKDYKKATALEALFGYLYLENNRNRIEEIINEIME